MPTINETQLLHVFREVDARLPQRARAAHVGAWSWRCEEQLERISPRNPRLLDDASRRILARGPLALPIAIAAQYEDPHAVLLSFGAEWFARARIAEIDELIADVFSSVNVRFARHALANREVSP